MIRIAPSILAADFLNLELEVDRVLQAGADWIHVDVMDGTFVPNISIGPVFVEQLRRRFPSAYLDVHLMISHPEQYVEVFAASGASGITIHDEATPHTHRVLQQIRQHGLSAGLAVNPGSSLSNFEVLLDNLDMLLVMTVNPGFGGQAFLPSTLRKIERAREICEERGMPDFPVEVDGGISPQTIGAAADAGATVFVAGSAIFGQPDYRLAIEALRTATTCPD